MKRFRHNDVDDLERVLSRVPDDSGKLVIVDGVYSMGGDFAHLPQIVEICCKYKARLLVDDAHGIGVAGGGRGTSAHFGLTDQVDLIMGTFRQKLRLNRRLHRRFGGCHPLRPASCALLDFLGGFAGAQSGGRYGRARHYRD